MPLSKPSQKQAGCLLRSRYKHSLASMLLQRICVSLQWQEAWQSAQAVQQWRTIAEQQHIVKEVEHLWRRLQQGHEACSLQTWLASDQDATRFQQRRHPRSTASGVHNACAIQRAEQQICCARRGTQACCMWLRWAQRYLGHVDHVADGFDNEIGGRRVQACGDLVQEEHILGPHTHLTYRC